MGEADYSKLTRYFICSSGTEPLPLKDDEESVKQRLVRIGPLGLKTFLALRRDRQRVDAMSHIPPSGP